MLYGTENVVLDNLSSNFYGEQMSHIIWDIKVKPLPNFEGGGSLVTHSVGRS